MGEKTKPIEQDNEEIIKALIQSFKLSEEKLKQVNEKIAELERKNV